MQSEAGMFAATEVVRIKKRTYTDAANLAASLQLWQCKWRRTVSLTGVYWRWQRRCCISSGNDTWRKENALGLQTPRRTSTAGSWKSEILWSGFVFLLLSRAPLWRGTGTQAWASHANVFGSLSKGAHSLPVAKLHAVPRGCLSPPGSACQTAVVGKLKFVILPFPLLVLTHLPFPARRLPAAAVRPLPPRAGVIDPRGVGSPGYGAHPTDSRRQIYLNTYLPVKASSLSGSYF